MKLAPKRKKVGPPNKLTKYKYGKEYRRLHNLLVQHDLKHNNDSFRTHKKMMHAAIVLLAGLELQTNDVDKIYRYLGYNVQKYCIQDMAQRLRKSGVWKNGHTLHEWNSDYGYVALTCDAMVATGMLKRREKRYFAIETYCP